MGCENTMNKRLIYICLIFILLLTILLTNVPRVYTWGYQSIGGDQINYFVRNKAIYSGETDIYHYSDNKEVVDIYPPGGHIFMSSFIMCTGVYDTFTAKLLLDTFIFVVLLYHFFLPLFIRKTNLKLES